MQRFFALSLLLLALAPWSASAQCGAGEVQVTIAVTTDDYGYETYWQLVPGGNVCGDGTIFAGGNPTMNCSSGGWQQQNMSGYGNGVTITEGPWCLTEGALYDIYSIDDWGDNQASFEVFVNGISIGQFQQMGATNVFTFVAQVPEARDMAVTDLTTSLYARMDESIRVRGTVKSFGADPVTSFELAYTVDGGADQMATISGVSLTAGDKYEFEHPIPWTPTSTGLHVLTVRVSSINGAADLVPFNDEKTSQHVISVAMPDLAAEYLASEPQITVIANSDQDIVVPRDLAFHPDAARNELWVINKETEQYGGSTVAFYHPGEQDMTFDWRHDVNAWHFMSLPTGIAMGDNNCFATSPGVFDANHNGGDPFTGPTLWSADTAIYCRYYGGLGSHLDMLHVDPQSQGIAHDHWNRYWVVDGYRGDIVMNDFRADHGPGNDYHGDAIIRRYAEFTVTQDPNNEIVSHCVMDKRNGWLYVVDLGGQRVLRLNTNTGQETGPGIYGPWESYVDYSMMGGYDWQVVITSGLLEPSGIEIAGDHLYVSDHANGDIVIYDLGDDAVPELGRIHTASPGLMGIAAGPDGRIWGVNATYSQLLRIDPQAPTSTVEMGVPQPRCWPVPADQRLFVDQRWIAADARFTVCDAAGRMVRQGDWLALATGIPTNDMGFGSYVLRLQSAASSLTIPFTVAH